MKFWGQPWALRQTLAADRLADNRLQLDTLYVKTVAGTTDTSNLIISQ